MKNFLDDVLVEMQGIIQLPYLIVVDIIDLFR